MTNIRTLTLALAPFILIVLVILALPYVHKHVEKYEVQNIEQRMTVDGFSEELVNDPERGGPIGIRVHFTVHAPKPLPMSRGAMFVSMGAALGKEVTNNPHVVRLFSLGKPKANFGVGHNETGQPTIFFTSEADTSDTYNEDVLLVLVRPQKDGSICIPRREFGALVRTGNYLLVTYYLNIQENGQTTMVKTVNLSDKVTALFRSNSMLQYDTALWDQMHQTINAQHLEPMGWKSCLTEKSKSLDCYCNNKDSIR